jgi:hypothetical protein
MGEINLTTVGLRMSWMCKGFMGRKIDLGWSNADLVGDEDSAMSYMRV